MTKLLCVSDIHGQFRDFPPDNMPDAEIALVAGDITNDGRMPELVGGVAWLNAMAAKFPAVVFIFGNHDLRLHGQDFASNEKGIYHAARSHRHPLVIGGLSIRGVSLSLAYNMPSLATTWRDTTTNPEMERVAFDLPYCDVLASHNPTSGGLGVTEDGQECGSVRLREWIEEKQPRLVVCGHIHNQGGKIETIGRTLVVNAARTWVPVELE